MDTAASAVVARGLTVHLGGRRHRTVALDNLDFQLATGQVTGLIGPSGSGKTTLMRAIVGVQRHTGELEVLGHPAGMRSLRGRIGYVTQSPSIYPDLSVRQNLSYFAQLADTRDVDRVLQQLSLGGVADRAVRSLSGGQRGRASLGCALVGEPDLLVLDEPTAGLDPVIRRSLRQSFREIADTGTTLVVSSHVMDEAARCDRLLLLREGKIIWAGTPTDLLAETKTRSFEDAFLVAVESPGSAGER